MLLELAGLVPATAPTGVSRPCGADGCAGGTPTGSAAGGPSSAPTGPPYGERRRRSPPPTDASDLRTRFDAELAAFLDRQGPDWPDGAPRGIFTALHRFVLAGGKRLRPLFCYWGWRGAGGADDRPIVVAAAALELFHAFALIHDDILDGSDHRRGASRRCTGSSPSCTPGRRGAATRRPTAGTPRCSAVTSARPGRIRCSTSAG